MNSRIKDWKTKALESYERFLTLWKDANPALPEVADAREKGGPLYRIIEEPEPAVMSVFGHAHTSSKTIFSSKILEDCFNISFTTSETWPIPLTLLDMSERASLTCPDAYEIKIESFRLYIDGGQVTCIQGYLKE